MAPPASGRCTLEILRSTRWDTRAWCVSCPPTLVGISCDASGVHLSIYGTLIVVLMLLEMICFKQSCDTKRQSTPGTSSTTSISLAMRLPACNAMIETAHRVLTLVRDYFTAPMRKSTHKNKISCMALRNDTWRGEKPQKPSPIAPFSTPRSLSYRGCSGPTLRGSIGGGPLVLRVHARAPD